MMAAIFVASSIPGDDLPDAGAWDTSIKKGGHMLGYALLALSWRRGLSWGRRPTLRDAGVALLLTVLYGATDELHQRLTPGRGPALADVGIDGLGGAAGLSFRRWWERGRPAAGRGGRPSGPDRP